MQNASWSLEYKNARLGYNDMHGYETETHIGGTGKSMVDAIYRFWLAL
jgi:hypothetical protein